MRGDTVFSYDYERDWVEYAGYIRGTAQSIDDAQTPVPGSRDTLTHTQSRKMQVRLGDTPVRGKSKEVRASGRRPGVPTSMVACRPGVRSMPRAAARQRAVKDSRWSLIVRPPGVSK